MATEAQIAANQANAQLSSGPTTEAGKAASSKNHLIHGLTYRGGTFVLLPWEDALDDGTIDDQRLALYLRYETTHERAFHKCLNELLKIRAEKRKAGLDEAALSQRAEDSSKAFESQKRKQEEHDRKQEQHKMKKTCTDGPSPSPKPRCTTKRPAQTA